MARQFGVADEQVRRDHAISHALAAISTVPQNPDELVFFGGTALARTILPTLRLSEDIDLMTFGERDTVARAVEAALERGLRRPLGRVEWSGPSLSQVADQDPAVALVGEGTRIRIQLLRARDYPDWPREIRGLVQRYPDAPEARLCTFTDVGFVTSKLSAWHDRATARDLYDLWALCATGHLDPAAVQVFRRLGPLGSADPTFTAPDEGPWQLALAHQGRVRVSARQAAAAVRNAWLRASAGTR